MKFGLVKVYDDGYPRKGEVFGISTEDEPTERKPARSVARYGLLTELGDRYLHDLIKREQQE